MRLDHLLSKEEKTFSVWSNPTKTEEGVGAAVYCLVTKERVRRPEGCARVRNGTCPGPSEAGGGLLVAMRPGETPVPIPNTMVKARAADGTALETVWESRWLPALKKEKEAEAFFR